MAAQETRELPDDKFTNWHDGMQFLWGFGLFGFLTAAREFGNWLGGGILFGEENALFAISNVWYGQAAEFIAMCVGCWFFAASIATPKIDNWYAVFVILAFVPAQGPWWSWLLFAFVGVALWKLLITATKRIRRLSRDADGTARC